MRGISVDASSQRTSIDVIASAFEPVIGIIGELSSPDGAVTLMLGDIANAKEVAAQLGPERWRQLLLDQEMLVRQLVERHDGQLVRSEDDGFLASFPSAHAGLQTALQLQAAFSGGLGAGSDRAIALRVGLHSGFVIANPDQLLGRNVVLASRIAAQAKGGEVLVSATLKQYTEHDPSFGFEARGEHHFKGVLGEHVVYAARLQAPDARSEQRSPTHGTAS